MSESTLTHDEALFMLNDHLGAEVSVWLSMDAPGGPFVIVKPMIGVLGKTGLGESVGDDIDPETITRVKQTVDPAYTVDGWPLYLPPLPGIVRRYEMGLEWVLADGLTLRINWGGG